MRLLPLLLAAPLALCALGSPLEAAPELARWSARLEPRDARPGEGARVVVRAVLAPGWNLYSTTQPPGGSQRTRIALAPGAGLKASGKIAQPAPIKKSNPTFNITDELYQGTVSFGVPVVLDPKSRGPQRGMIEVRFQLCSDRLCSPLQTVRVPFAWAPRPGKARASRKRAVTSAPGQPKTFVWGGNYFPAAALKQEKRLTP